MNKYNPAAFAGFRLVAVSVADTGRKVVEPAEVVEPVEVGVTVFDDGRVADTRTWSVRPSRPVTVWATRGHGIDDRALAEVGEILAGRIVVAVRASHCRAMLAPVLPDWRPPRLVPTVAAPPTPPAATVPTGWSCPPGRPSCRRCRPAPTPTPPPRRCRPAAHCPTPPRVRSRWEWGVQTCHSVPVSPSWWRTGLFGGCGRVEG
ncbi:MAG TPA: hypothetical protein VFX70_20820 [Mycobacteriales bacterium]|nr:hypothetical protein [Mycobacteriales bacterium]